MGYIHSWFGCVSTWRAFESLEKEHATIWRPPIVESSKMLTPNNQTCALRIRMWDPSTPRTPKRHSMIFCDKIWGYRFGPHCLVKSFLRDLLGEDWETLLASVTSACRHYDELINCWIFIVFSVLKKMVLISLSLVSKHDTKHEWTWERTSSWDSIFMEVQITTTFTSNPTYMLKSRYFATIVVPRPFYLSLAWIAKN
jgi:hypothetical protein